MYGKLVTCRSSEVVVSVKQIGERIAVVCSDGSNEQILCFIEKQGYEYPTVRVPKDIKFVVETNEVKEPFNL